MLLVLGRLASTRPPYCPSLIFLLAPPKNISATSDHPATKPSIRCRAATFLSKLSSFVSGDIIYLMESLEPATTSRQRAEGTLGMVAEWASAEKQKKEKKPLRVGVEEYNKSALSKDLQGYVDKHVGSKVCAYYAA
jgi:hypothetical protein